MTKRMLTLSILMGAIFLLTMAPVVNAAFPGEPIVPAGCLKEGAPADQCGLKEMVDVAVNISKLILGLLGSVTLLFFIYGGFVWITAAGNTQRIEQGKKVLEGALVGLIIVLSSWLIIYFITAALTGTPPGGHVKLFGGEEPFRIPQ